MGKHLSGGFRVLHSSAGAGKTHTLVKHYLLRCLETGDPRGYRQVLALTFTNKAAEEMRQRVLVYLRQLATHSAGSNRSAALEDVVRTLVEQLRHSEQTLQERAKQMLGHMLHDRSSVAISTIDAFIKRVVQPFSRDLRLCYDFDLSTEEEYYREQAVDRLLDKVGEQDELTIVLKGAADRLIEDERSWDVVGPMMDLGKELGKERSIEYLRRYAALAPKDVLHISKHLSKQINAFRGKVRTVGRVAVELLRSHDLQEADLAYKSRGALSYFNKLVTFNGGRLPEPSKAVRASLEDGPLGHPKVDLYTRNKAETCRPALWEIAQQALALQESELNEHLLPEAIRTDLMLVATLYALEAELDQVKSEQDVLFFSDLTRRISELVQEEPAPFIFERIGERYRHFLIDEFQDTSILQWHDLLPLVENALSNGGSALLVGDAKQAIYRWRNGEVRQFTSLPELFQRERIAAGAERERTLQQHFVRTPPLAHNFRSGKAIVAFNEKFFDRARQVLHTDLRSVYEDHAQVAAASTNGSVNIEVIESDGRDKDGPVLERLVNLVNELVEQGVTPGSMGILVRSAKQIAQVTQYLLQAGHNIRSRDGLRLKNDHLTNAVIHLLRYAARPNDAAAARVLSHLGSSGTRSDLHHATSKDDMHAMVRETLEGIGTHSDLYGLVAAVINAIEPSIATDIMMLTLLDEASSFSRAHGSDLPGFLAYWDRVGAQRSAQLAADHNAIQVMTIHSSKGLEFPVVIIPFADMNAGGTNADKVWIDASAHGLPSALVRMKKELVELAVPELVEESQLDLLDQLNLLYVAMTRPVDQLHVLVQDKANGPTSVALKEFIGAHSADPRTFRSGDPEIRRHDQIDRHSVPLNSAPLNDQIAKLSFRKEAPNTWSADDPDPFRTHGHLIHKVFEHTRTVDDLKVAIGRCFPQGQAPNGLYEQLSEILERPEMGPFFKHDLEVYTEVDLILPNGHTIRPDRIVKEEGQTRVLDIKTGAPKDFHKEQVASYVRALEEIGEPDVTGAILYLKDGILEPV